ncbi:MAG: hypothetical protein EP346_00910 [Bacteroidetes bacterium]|nr:MAG: hypothetical protein EP346_00910 [Bacteroidota bacterium]
MRVLRNMTLMRRLTTSNFRMKALFSKVSSFYLSSYSLFSIGFVIILFSTAVRGQQPWMDQSTQQLPAREVYHVVEDSIGVKYVCTEQGAFAMYGSKVIPLDKSLNGELSTIYNLYVDPIGRIWALTASSGVFYLDKGVWVAPPFNDDLNKKTPRSHFVYYMWVSEDGNHLIFDLYANDLSFATCSFTDDKIEIHTPIVEERFRVTPAIIERDGKDIFHLMMGGLDRYISRTVGFKNLNDSNRRIDTSFVSAWGEKLKIRYMNHSDLKKLCDSEPPPRRSRISLVDQLDSSGVERHFITTQHTLFEILENGDIKAAPILFCDHVAFRVIDNELYCCTLSDGITRYALKGGELVQTGHFFDNQSISDIYKTKSGYYWICDINEGLRIIPNINLTNYEVQDLTFPNRLTRPFHYYNGLFYAAVSDTIYSLQLTSSDLSIVKKVPIPYRPIVNSRFHRSHWQDSVLNDLFLTTSITHPEHHRIWSVFPAGREKSFPFLGTSFLTKSTANSDWTKYYVLNEGKLFSVDTHHVFTEEVSIPTDSSFIIDFLLSNDSIDYVLTERNLYRKTNSSYLPLLNEELQNSIKTSQLYKLGTDWLVLPSYNDGIYLLGADTTIHLTAQNYLPSDYTISVSTYKNVLITASEKSLFVLVMKGNEIAYCRILPLHDYVAENSIREIIPGDTSIFVFHGNQVLKAPLEYIMNLPDDVQLNYSNLRVNGIETALDENNHLNLNRGTAYISVKILSANSVQNRGQLLRWRLTPDAPWEYDESGDLSFSNLRYGSYNLEVQLRSEYGVWSNIQSIFTFQIRPFITDTWWFWTLLTSPLLIILAIAIIVNERRKKQDKQLIESNMATLKMQINPHFIFNAFNSIQYLINSNRNSTASEYLKRLAVLIRKTISRPDLHRVSLEEEIQYLDEFMSIELLRLEDCFDFIIEIDSDINTKTTFVPPMLIQPLLENAVWHGVSNKTDRGIVKLIIKRQLNTIEIHITDNGDGFPLSEWRAMKQGISNKGSLGLRNVLQRLELLAALYEKTYELELRPENTGTHFVMTIGL